MPSKFQNRSPIEDLRSFIYPPRSPVDRSALRPSMNDLQVADVTKPLTYNNYVQSCAKIFHLRGVIKELRLQVYS